MNIILETETGYRVVSVDDISIDYLGLNEVRVTFPLDGIVRRFYSDCGISTQFLTSGTLDLTQFHESVAEVTPPSKVDVDIPDIVLDIMHCLTPDQISQNIALAQIKLYPAKSTVESRQDSAVNAINSLVTDRLTVTYPIADWMASNLSIPQGIALKNMAPHLFNTVLSFYGAMDALTNSALTLAIDYIKRVIPGDINITNIDASRIDVDGLFWLYYPDSHYRKVLEKRHALVFRKMWECTDIVVWRSMISSGLIVPAEDLSYVCFEVQRDLNNIWL